MVIIVERNKTIDIVRGICMLLVIAGHCNQYVDANFKIWLHSFHIPLFSQ